MDPLIFFVNGKKAVNLDVEKEAVELVQSWFQDTYRKRIQSNHYNVNACLAPLCSIHGMAVTTVEGIGTVNNLHPVQERIAKFHGSQCGFCTPGIVMSMYTLLRNNPEPTSLEMEQYFDGNLCRCTGYRSILEGFRTFTQEYKCSMGENCCQNGPNSMKSNESHKQTIQQIIASDMKPYDPTQEIIFPPELKINHQFYNGKMVSFRGANVRWFSPKTLDQLLQLQAQYKNAKLIGGNTEIGIETKFKNQVYSVLIQTSRIPELSDVNISNEGITVGASVTLSHLQHVLGRLIESEKDYKTRSFRAVVEMLRWFASHQIRNVATVSGNIITASPISDLNPLFLAAGAKVKVIGEGGKFRSIPMDKNFFRGYRKTAISIDEVLVSITIPFTQENEHFAGFKQANRKDDDISLVNAGMYVQLSESHQINNMTLAFGGMGATIKVAKKTMNSVIGDVWNKALIPKACDLLAEDLPLAPGSPGGVVEFRRTVALSFFFKFFVQVDHELHQIKYLKDISAITTLNHGVSKGIQLYGARDSREKTNQSVGEPTIHLSAFQQSTGEAAYIDDMPMTVDEVYLALVTSTMALAKLISVDPSSALTAPGVKGFVAAKDVIGKNALGGNMGPIFAEDEVTCQGQVIGAVIADTQARARAAAKMVKIEYEERTPVITIKDAIKTNSLYDGTVRSDFGDLEAGFKQSDHIVDGEAYINGQNHFYMETIATRAVPLENGEMEVFCCTQNLNRLQFDIATALDVIASKVVVRTKRMGGGFGGKESQCVLSAVPTAVAARKLHRTVRCVLDRDEDMVTTGNRHPFLGKYKVGFSSDGKIIALDLEMYSNGGNAMDLSFDVMKKAVLQLDNCYFFPAYRVVGRVCRTNIMSNTAFRGFGAPQGHFIMENIVERVAAFLNIDLVQVQERNFYRPEDEARHPLANQCKMITRCWDTCKEKSNFVQRKNQIDTYNRKSRWLKKGIALTPLQYGPGFIERFLNQAGALVHIYRDGSIWIAHGGTEMGQGLNVKVAQVNAAFFARIGLSATGFYIVPEIGYDFETQKGKPFSYFTLGAACSEVQIDCLTGDHKILRTDIVIDAGKSINPAIDVGQIEGSFMQGYGLFILEKVKVTPSGFHLTQGPGNYKIPSFGNIPLEFNVSLIEDSVNPSTVFASKGIGEPPLLLVVSVFFAIKDAIKAARRDAGEGVVFPLNSPAVPAAIRMACSDEFSKRFPIADSETYKPWFVNL